MVQFSGAMGGLSALVGRRETRWRASCKSAVVGRHWQPTRKLPRDRPLARCVQASTLQYCDVSAAPNLRVAREGGPAADSPTRLDVGTYNRTRRPVVT